MTNETPLTDEQRDLAASNTKLAWWHARKWSQRWPAFHDEIESAAMLGLVRAARNFDPSMGIKFSTLASPRIRGQIKNGLRDCGLKGFKRDDRVPDGTPVPRAVPFNSSLDCGVDDPPDYADSFEHAIKPLPENLRQVCRRHYLYGEPMKAIAHAEGVSLSEISRLHCMAIKFLTPIA